ncbi:hypothetical protein [Clostridium sp.]|uniref:phage lytic cycle repressor MrpR family protein n=1 Tax=Clostridium sp. TaxID=1506 RepID=UPI003217C9F0
MYNEDLKERYIKEINNEVILPNNYLRCQFNKVSNMEFELKKDICNFTAYEIIEYYKILNVSSFDSLIVMNSQFSKYTQWCLQENLVKDNQNHFLELTLEQIKNCVNKALFNKKIVSLDTILSWCEQLPNPKDQFIMLALFEGLKGKDFCDISRLKPEDIKGHTANLYTGRSVELSSKLLNIIDDCMNENTYYSITGEGIKTMPLIFNGYIVKDYPNVKADVSEFQIGRKIYNSITRSLNYVGMLKYMSANSIFESGKLYMINKRAKELNMSAEEYIYSDYINEVEKKYNCKIVKSTFCLKYKEYLV